MNLKSKKGSIAIFVLVALLFMSAILLLMYASSIINSKIVKEQFNIISGIYAYANGEEGAYDKAYSDLRNKNKQTMTASSENSSTLELTKTFDENMSNYRIYGNGRVPKLPEEYQEVEYIESTGTQYINTGYKPNNSMNIELRVELPSTLTLSETGTLLGVEDSSVKYVIARGRNIEYGAIFKEKSYGAPQMFQIKKDVIDNYVMKDNKVYINGELKYTETNSIEHQFDINLYLLARNNNGTASNYDSRRLYSAKIYDNETLVRDFVPCYRKSDNAIGLYDLVNNVFYTNAGTGTFNKGSNETIEGEITNIYLDEPLRKVGDVADYIDFKTGKVVRNIGKIDSYNGETITTSWISSTGELSTGATVYYVLETPTEETVTLPQLKPCEDYTKIEVLTSAVPSKIEVEYMGYTLD